MLVLECVIYKFDEEIIIIVIVKLVLWLMFAFKFWMLK